MMWYYMCNGSIYFILFFFTKIVVDQHASNHSNQQLTNELFSNQLPGNSDCAVGVSPVWFTFSVSSWNWRWSFRGEVFADLIDFIIVMHFIKPVIWSALQIKWIISLWNATLGLNVINSFLFKKPMIAQAMTNTTKQYSFGFREWLVTTLTL